MGTVNRNCCEQYTEPAGALSQGLAAILAPIVRIRLTEAGGLGESAFALRSNARYAHATVVEGSINLWSALLYGWPEVIAAVALLATTIAMLRLARIMRRPQLLGAPYCRRCNYCLHGLVSNRCPECGTNLTAKAPEIGRRFSRRALPLMCLPLLLWLGLGAAIGAGVPRYGWASNLWAWPSETCWTWALRNDCRALLRFAQPERRYVDVDLSSATVTPARNAESFLAESPDQSLLLGTTQGALLIRAASTGALVREIAACAPRDARWSDRGLSFSTWDIGTRSARLWLWNPHCTDPPTLLAACAGYPRLLPGAPLRWLEEVVDGPRHTFRLWNVPGAAKPLSQWDIVDDEGVIAFPSRNSERLYSLSMRARRLDAWDMRTGQRVGTLRCSDSLTDDWRAHAYDGINDIVYVAAGGDRIHVADMSTQKWLGWFQHPVPWVLQLQVSGDGETLAILAWHSRTPGAAKVIELVVYARSSIIAHLGSP